MDGLAELLILLLFLLGPILFGYLVAHLYPVEVLRKLLGVTPAAPDLRLALRRFLRVPDDADDADLFLALADLRSDADRAPAPPFQEDP